VIICGFGEKNIFLGAMSPLCQTCPYQMGGHHDEQSINKLKIQWELSSVIKYRF